MLLCIRVSSEVMIKRVVTHFDDMQSNEERRVVTATATASNTTHDEQKVRLAYRHNGNDHNIDRAVSRGYGRGRSKRERQSHIDKDREQ